MYSLKKLLTQRVRRWGSRTFALLLSSLCAVLAVCFGVVCQVGEARGKELESERDQVRALLQQLDSDRSALGPDANPHDYAENLKAHCILKSHFENVKVELAGVIDKCRIAACYQESGYHGIPDWAEKSSAKYADLCDSIGTASVFGAGITYTTIFSAPRGNLSLMCWSFALFDVGFIITILARMILKWASRLPLPRSNLPPHVKIKLRNATSGILL